MYKVLPITAIALFLAACTTPQGRCISDVMSEQYGLQRQIVEIEGNISRGYAIHSQTVPYTYVDTCFDDAMQPYACPKTGTRVEETPVAINIAEQRRKLRPLQQRLASVRARTDARVAQCRVLYPE